MEAPAAATKALATCISHRSGKVVWCHLSAAGTFFFLGRALSLASPAPLGRLPGASPGLPLWLGGDRPAVGVQAEEVVRVILAACKALNSLCDVPDGKCTLTH